MNSGFCNRCGQLVAANPIEKDGRVFLVKDCPKCGPTQTLIASDAKRYNDKHSLDMDFEYRHCRLNCMKCRHKNPNMVFIDITNRCNMNCPICINNTPSMGFQFEPPLEYFEKIFKEMAKIEPRPMIQLFGGEPTVHRKLFEIIELARAQRLSVRVVTNGLKLADEDYCRRLIDSRATILIAYDGDNPELYETLRGSKGAKVLGQKLKAFDNIAKIGGAKVGVMSLVAKGFNDDSLDRLFAFCHEHRANVRGVYLMPLAHTWRDGHFDKEPDRITPEDIEACVAQAWPGERVDFMPAGFTSQTPNILKYLRVRRLPFIGAHPNCESFYLLVSDGEKFQPAGHFLKHSTLDLCRDIIQAEPRITRMRAGLLTSLFGKIMARLRVKRTFLFLYTLLTMLLIARRHVRLDRLVRGVGPLGRAWSLASISLRLLFRQSAASVAERHLKVREMLQVIILPFEDRENLETERLERCPAAFAYVDPADGKVKHTPACAWGLFKTDMMKKISEYYQTAGNADETAEPEAVVVNK